MKIVALVVGATGIAGRGVSQELLRAGARVHGVSRHRDGIVPGVEHVAADLQDPASVVKAVSGLKPSHVYLTVWSRRPTEEENIKVNAGMVRTVLDALAPARSVKHVALVTGLKHYLDPSRPTREAGSFRQPRCERSSRVSTSRTSTTTRKTKCTPPQRGTDSPGACTVRIQSLARRSATQ